MIQLIAPEFHQNFRDELAEMHRLRGRVFKGRLDWAVHLEGDQELDRFDSLQPHYLLLYAHGRLVGSVRLLPTTGPTMLSEVFTGLLDGAPAPSSPAIWESSRFAVDLPDPLVVRKAGLAPETYELLAGMIEFGLLFGLSAIVTVTDARMERILRRATWPLRALGGPRRIGATNAIAGSLDVSRDSLSAVKSAGGLLAPVLWIPALGMAA
jgi:acyl homoserine lactone synthase